MLFIEQLGGKSEFEASFGRLHNFKSRHNIRELEIQREITRYKWLQPDKFICQILFFLMGTTQFYL